MFQIQDLSAKKEGKQLLKKINLTLEDGEGVVVFGPNGGGKSTLFKSIMGLNDLEVKGKVLLDGKDILKLDIDKRVGAGIGYMYQTPPLVKGVDLSTLLAQEIGFKGDVNELYVELKDSLKELDMEYLFDREINVGLSGGEVKRSELLTLSALKDSKIFLLDEPDSGVDIENVKRIGKFIATMVKGKSYMLVTHSGDILNHLKPSRGVVVVKGEVVFEGSVDEILKEVRKNGYSKFSQKLS